MLVLYILILMFTNSINHLQKDIHSTFINRITIITLLVSILFTFNTLYFQSIGKGISIFSGLFQTTVQSHMVEIFLLIVGASILLGWPLASINNPSTTFSANAERWREQDQQASSMLNNQLFGLDSSPSTRMLRREQGRVRGDQYSLIALFSILGGSLLMSSLDLLSMYLSIELQSFALYILATLNKDQLSSTSAGLKYFLLGSLSSCLILLGSAIIYSYTGLTQFEAINTLLSVQSLPLSSAQLLSPFPQGAGLWILLPEHPVGLELSSDINKAFTIAVIIILIGFLFKVSAAPFYQWAPAVCTGKTHEWEKLSNSGELLKLMIPSYIRKIISGWSNLPCMVTTHKMSENEMEYRGSKSVKPTVKEQRVDGSWFLAKKARSLRCTLMGREICYQVKIPSKQLNSQNFSFSTLTINKPLGGENNIKPWFLTGFIDAEGCFQISIRQDKKYKTNWRISLTFQIKLHVKDIHLLNNFKNTFGVGTITLHKKDTANFNVYSIKELQVIIDHCIKYPLITQKYSDFLLFKQAFEIIKKGDHLTEKGVFEIVGLKSTLNLGLSDKLRAAFLNFVPVPRPAFQFKGVPDPFWVAGFISGEGSFYLNIRSKISPTSTTGNTWRSVSLIFGVTLHFRDKEVIQALASYFTLLNGKGLDSSPSPVGCGVGGVVKPHTVFITKHSVSLHIRRLSEIVNVIIPFFDKHPILGVKSLDFADWKRVAELVQIKGHLTSSGFESIQKINYSMNLRRPWGPAAVVRIAKNI